MATNETVTEPETDEVTTRNRHTTGAPVNESDSTAEASEVTAKNRHTTSEPAN